MSKNIGFIGLGKMGSLMVENLLDHKYKVIAYNRSKEPLNAIAKKGATPTFSIEELVSKLKSPRIIMIMITAGKPVDDILNSLKPYLKKGDIIIDGGNSHYKDSIRRANNLKKKDIHFIDLGVSGGLSGARNGASLMVGGDKNIFKKIEPILKDLSVKNGYGYLGSSGSGHFVKTIHNGIEYALLESYAEGYNILHESKLDLDLKEVSRVWSNGSVIRSWITELAESALKKCNNDLSCFVGKIGGGETGEWTLEIAKKLKVDATTLEHAIKTRKKSQKRQNFATRFIAAIRQEFGGHKEPL